MKKMIAAAALVALLLCLCAGALAADSFQVTVTSNHWEYVSSWGSSLYVPYLKLEVRNTGTTDASRITVTVNFLNRTKMEVWDEQKDYLVGSSDSPLKAGFSKTAFIKSDVGYKTQVDTSSLPSIEAEVYINGDLYGTVFINNTYSEYATNTVLSGKATAAAKGWTCGSCGKESTGNFCANCGAANPEWTCPSCGATSTARFCGNDGTPRTTVEVPAADLTGLTLASEWTCPSCKQQNDRTYCMMCGTKRNDWICGHCGQTNTTKFCSNCGTGADGAAQLDAGAEDQPGEASAIMSETWTCSCGAQNTTKFCLECGSQRASWNCKKCQTVNTAKFCTNCGKSASWEVVNYISFGHYPQTAAGTDSTPIEWIILKVEGNQALVISRYGLDAHRYHSTTPYPTWEKSDIRAWLNSTFLNAAFTAEEQEAIITTTVHTGNNDAWVAFGKKKGWSSTTSVSGGADTQDKVFLLSLEEAMSYGGYATLEDFYSKGTDKLKAVPTEYAVAQGAYQYTGTDNSYKLEGSGCCWWWLRSPGYGSDYASRVFSSGSLGLSLVGSTTDVVRPAFWINLDSAAIY